MVEEAAANGGFFRKNGALDHGHMKRPRHNPFKFISHTCSFLEGLH